MITIQEALEICRANLTKREDRVSIPDLDKIEDINFQDNNGNTLLMLASCFGDIDVVEQLLKRDDINVNLLSDDTSALMTACFEGRLPVIKLLLDHPDIDLSLEDDDGYNAFYLHIFNSPDDKIIEKFLNNPKKGMINLRVVNLCEEFYPELFERVKQIYEIDNGNK